MYTKPNIALPNSELVLKAERNNAEVRLENVEEYPKVVDAEWNILQDKLSRISAFRGQGCPLQAAHRRCGNSILFRQR